MSSNYEREKDRLRSLILGELKQQETLKKELLAELNRKRSLGATLQHPAVLLVLGFFFTSVLGATFTSYWQSRQWHQQQALQSRQRAMEQKYQIATDVAYAVGEYYAAGAGVMAAIQIDNDASRREELNQRVKEWRAAKQQWLAKSSTLLQRLTTHFAVKEASPEKEPADARSMFINISDSLHLSNVAIGNLLDKLEKNRGRRSPEINQERGRILEEGLNQVRDVEMEKLMKQIASEIRTDIYVPEPPELQTFWRFLLPWSSDSAVPSKSPAP